MTTSPNLRVIAENAKQKGYFALEDYPGLRLNPLEMCQLLELLAKKNIPFGAPEETQPLSIEKAKAIIDALRRGIPPQDGTKNYSVGRENLLLTVKNDLSTVIQKKSLVRFINADVGQGKTHFLYLLRELAFDQDFAVSIVTLSQSSCPLFDFMAVYRNIMWNLRTVDQRYKPALSNIFDRWLCDIRLLSEKCH
jgi:hypothetical protein